MFLPTAKLWQGSVIWITAQCDTCDTEREIAFDTLLNTVGLNAVVMQSELARTGLGSKIWLSR